MELELKANTWREVKKIVRFYTNHAFEVGVSLINYRYRIRIKEVER